MLLGSTVLQAGMPFVLPSSGKVEQVPDEMQPPETPNKGLSGGGRKGGQEA